MTVLDRKVFAVLDPIAPAINFVAYFVVIVACAGMIFYGTRELLDCLFDIALSALQRRWPRLIPRDPDCGVQRLLTVSTEDDELLKEKAA